MFNSCEPHDRDGLVPGVGLYDSTCAGCLSSSPGVVYDRSPRVGVARSSGFGSRSVSLIISLGSTQHRNPATFRAVCALALASLEPLAPLEQVGHVLASESSIELEGRAQLLEGLAGGPRVDDLHAILLHMLLVFRQQQRP